MSKPWSKTPFPGIMASTDQVAPEDEGVFAVAKLIAEDSM